VGSYLVAPSEGDIIVAVVEVVDDLGMMMMMMMMVEIKSCIMIYLLSYESIRSGRCPSELWEITILNAATGLGSRKAEKQSHHLHRFSSSGKRIFQQCDQQRVTTQQHGIARSGCE
jgi:hypothetical protein